MKQHSVPLLHHPSHSSSGAAHRIAYVAPRYTPYIGGVETHITQIAARAVAQGHHVEVLTQSHERDLPSLESIDGVIVRRFPVLLHRQTYAVAPGLWAHLRQYGRSFDIVHAHSYHALPALGAALMSCRPLIFTPHYHGSGHSPLRSLLHVPYRALGGTVMRGAVRIIAVSQAEAALICRHFPRANGRITVIPNGVLVSALRVAEPFPEERRVILSAGRLEDYKNVQQVVRALAHLDAGYVLRVIGSGPAQADLEALTSRLGLMDRVQFLGRVRDEELHRWYRTAAVYASVSSREAFGITVIESLVAGARVVATDIPAHREIAATPGVRTVTLVPLDATPQLLAHALDAAARQTGGDTHSSIGTTWDAVAEQTLNVYRDVVAAAVS